MSGQVCFFLGTNVEPDVRRAHEDTSATRHNSNLRHAARRARAPPSPLCLGCRQARSHLGRGGRRRLLRTYHTELLREGVPASYTWERCWRDYKMQLWWPLVQLLTMTPAWAKQKAAKKGMWAERPTAADVKLKEMYDTYHPRLVAALTDHAWDQMLIEGHAECGACSCFSFCP